MNYYITHQQECNEKTNELVKEMPEFVTNFLASKNRIEESTRLEYARDIKLFLDFFLKDHEDIKSIADITCADLDGLSPDYFNSYIATIGHADDIKSVSGGLMSRSTKMRKLSSLNSFFSYLFKCGYISSNPVANVEKFALKKREIITLDVDEVAELINAVDKGPDEATERRKSLYHKKTRTRDLMIVNLLLSTGIRVSECVGIDVDDVSIKKCSIRITRKGNKEDTVYMSDKICEEMKEYLEYRKSQYVSTEGEKALFLSYQGKRLSVRSVEKLVKKYNELAENLKHISPHKLRSTYGSQMYLKLKDIYAVATLMGHESVETTKKYYVKPVDKSQIRNTDIYEKPE